MTILDDLVDDLFKKEEKIKKPHSQLSSQAAHHLWNLANIKYIFLNNVNLFLNYAHDGDFRYILGEYNKKFESEVNTVEEEIKKYSIKSPKPNARNMKIEQKTQAVHDQDMAQTFYMLLRANVTVNIKTIKDTIFNDELRNLFTKQTKDAIDYVDNYIEFLKLKSWISYPPMYETTTFEKEVSGNEVYHLWEHLVYRYINITQTKMYTSLVSDNDFKVILEEGIDVLTKQAKQIEDNLLQLGVSLPTEYPKNIPMPQKRKIIEDEYIYNIILEGMQNATFLHGASIQEMIVEDDIRALFKKLLYKELELLDDLTKYGKIKGWIQNPPKLQHV